MVGFWKVKSRVWYQKNDDDNLGKKLPVKVEEEKEEERKEIIVQPHETRERDEEKNERTFSKKRVRYRR